MDEVAGDSQAAAEALESNLDGAGGVGDEVRQDYGSEAAPN